MKTLEVLQDCYPRLGGLTSTTFLPRGFWPDEESFCVRKKADVDHMRRRIIVQKIAISETKTAELGWWVIHNVHVHY